MKKALYLILAVLPLTVTPLQAQDINQAKTLVEQAQNALFSNPKQASYYAAQAAALFPEDQPNEICTQAMILHSQAEQLLGNFDLSIKNLYDTQRYINPANKRQTAQLYSLMGRVYSKLGDYNKGIELNDKATSIFKSLGDSASVAGCYNERGVMHYLLDEFVVAEKFLQRALTINRAQRNLKEIATNLNNLCLYQGDTEKKLSLIQEAIAINKNLDAQWSLGENYNNMGKQYYFGEQYSKALEALQKAYEYAHNIGAKELICDNYEYSSWVYAAIGDYKQAYTRLSQMYALSKELQSSNKLRNIEQEISYKRYQDQKYATEMQEQTYKIELLKRNLWFLGSVLVLGLAFSIFLYKWYKRRKGLQLIEARYQLELSQRELSELKLHQQELELQNIQNALDSSQQEVTSFAVFLRSRNELLDKIREMIKEGYKMDNQALIPHLKKVNAYISQYQSGDKTNNALLLNIEDKSKEFIERLTKEHPNLTQGEKYLATMLRVNLSTKEISMISGNSPKTINMNRYRLRKALNLPTEKDLVEYLQNY
ncbi:tetratricopeptide repeat protein [Bacteroides stercorirosoris]|jgi:tetratricopeptide (TPR) repeat protein/DNA-binding CsgD family transcriptional regulator|uniref:tetratricopeptide repeat protein n=1 Tax=Bacteroides stercorirosoris TaxID=871324 RepID=UPI000969C98B|nr:tetratricopeptide repeat protein [Bacteroides stercorirosoris]OKZ09500.1 MAG: LuxR family transcriptional regulator [Bacteroides oleiciplenus]